MEDYNQNIHFGIVAFFVIALTMQGYEVFRRAPNNQISVVALVMTSFIAVGMLSRYFWHRWRQRK
jgi:hypothetical protein